MKLEYFTAPWCGPCRTFGPMLQSVAKDQGLDLEKINIQDEPERLPADVLGIPTVILYVADEEVSRFTGAKSEFDLNRWLFEAGVLVG